MSPARLNPGQLAGVLAPEPPGIRKIVRRLRKTILSEVPHAAEAERFGCLCYFHPEAKFGSIGGNICMIEARRGEAILFFIHGARLPDPHELLRGRGKAKRFLPIGSPEAATESRVVALLRRSAAMPACW